jgi:hypothetical protein
MIKIIMPKLNMNKLKMVKLTMHYVATKWAAAVTRVPKTQIGDIRVIRKVPQTGHENPPKFGKTGHGSRIFSSQKFNNLE